MHEDALHDGLLQGGAHYINGGGRGGRVAAARRPLPPLGRADGEPGLRDDFRRRAAPRRAGGRRRMSLLVPAECSLEDGVFRLEESIGRCGVWATARAAGSVRAALLDMRPALRGDGGGACARGR